jgi:meso-butanediol dehydrogenase / (S,S)-butanediol dehydrogenase / diacetyl reductase
VAGFVAYLAGPGADYMTSQAGLIDGGIVYR